MRPELLAKRILPQSRLLNLNSGDAQLVTNMRITSLKTFFSHFCLFHAHTVHVKYKIQLTQNNTKPGCTVPVQGILAGLWVSRKMCRKLLSMSFITLTSLFQYDEIFTS